MAERTNVVARARAEEDEARSAEEIRQDIAQRRESITETVDQLSDRFQETFDWRTYVADYPLVAVGLAAGAGFLLAGLFKPRPSPRDRIMDAVAESVEGFTGRVRGALDELPGNRKLGGTRAIKAALTAMATKAIADYAKNKFYEVVSRRQGVSSQEDYEGTGYHPGETPSRQRADAGDIL